MLPTTEDLSAPGTLRRLEITCGAVIGLGAAGLVAVALALPHARQDLGTFLLGAWAAWALTGAKLWRNRDKGGRARGSAPVELGAATAVTLARAWLIAVVAGHLLLPVTTGGAAVLVALTYTVAAILDGVDGRVARKRAFTSDLGARLDVATDALGLLVASLVAVRAGRLPPWYLMLGLAYPTMQLGLRAREALGGAVFRARLRPNPRARFFAGVQMGVVATALYPVLPPPLLFAAATLAMLPTLALFVGEWRLATAPASPTDGGPRRER